MAQSLFFSEYDLSKARRSSENRAPFAHQRQALDGLQRWREAAPKDNAGGIVVLPTGGGKTFTAVRFLCATVISKGYKILWLAHTHHLLEQAYGAFANSLGKIEEPKRTLAIRVVSGTLGHYSVHQIEPTDDVVVATLQTMTRAHEVSHPDLTAFLKSAGNRLCVVFDEAHHAPAPSYRKLLKLLRSEHAEMLLIGLTATPTYSDPRKQGWLKELFPQGIIHQSKALDLLANGILARPIFEKVATEVSLDFDEGEYQRWVETYQDIPEHIIKSLAENDERNQTIANQYLANRERYGQTIIFAERWYQCLRIAAILRANGVRVDSVFSHIDASPAGAEARNARSSTENHQVIQKYKRGELDVLLNVKMLTEGTDVPMTQTVFVTRQTTSTILLTQMVGRALRGPKVGGTEEAYIVSFEDNWKQKINWAEFDQLSEGLITESDVRPVAKPPFHLISIDLLCRLVAQMDSTVNRTPAPFLQLMPIGWFRADIQSLVEGEGTDDIETVRPLVMVFEDQAAGFHEYLEHLQSEDLSDFMSERVLIGDVTPRLQGWLSRFFPERDDLDKIGQVGVKDLFHLARHVAQNEGERPRWFPFEDRSQYNLDMIAQELIDKDLGATAVKARLEAEYENPERYWKTLYSNFINFKTQYDACVNRLQSPPSLGPPPETTRPVAPPDLPEPPDHVKAQVMSRDRYACLCCGEITKRRLQVDHVHARYLGGSHSLENLQTLCKVCNRQKGTVLVSFMRHRDPMRLDPPSNFPPLRAFPKTSDPVGEADFWSQTLRRAINFYYGAAAVESVDIGRKGQRFYDWSIRLFGGNDARWIAPHLPRLVEEIQAVRSQAGFKGPEGIRVAGTDGYEAAHFTDANSGNGSTRFRGIPNGTVCRLSVDGQVYEGTIRQGELKVGRYAPFASFSAAFKELAGRSGNGWKAWEVRLPGSSDWGRADVIRAQFEAGSTPHE